MAFAARAAHPLSRLVVSTDEEVVKIPCAACRNPFAKVRLHRVGHRLLCRLCFKALKRRESGELGPPIAMSELQSMRRMQVVLTSAGLAIKGLTYAFFFWWASGSEIGAAALEGLFSADIFTFLIFCLLEWQFHGFRIRLGGAFELVLVLIYLNRHSLFKISEDPERMAVTMLSFLLVVIVKAGIWAAEHAVEVSGVKEPV